MPSSDENGGAYEVEKILKDRKRKGRVEYLIHWKGYDSSEDEWVPARNMACPDLLKAYRRTKRESIGNRRSLQKGITASTSVKSKASLSANVESSLSSTPLQTLDENASANEDIDEPLSTLTTSDKNPEKRGQKRKFSDSGSSNELGDKHSVATGLSSVPNQKASESEHSVGDDSPGLCDFDDNDKNGEKNVDNLAHNNTNDLVSVRLMSSAETERSEIIVANINRKENISASKQDQVLSELLKKVTILEGNKSPPLKMRDVIARSHLIYIKEMEKTNGENAFPRGGTSDYYKLGYKADKILLVLGRPHPNAKQYALVKFAISTRAQLLDIDYVKKMDSKLVENCLSKLMQQTSE